MLFITYLKESMITAVKIGVPIKITPSSQVISLKLNLLSSEKMKIKFGFRIRETPEMQEARAISSSFPIYSCKAAAPKKTHIIGLYWIIVIKFPYSNIFVPL